VVSQEKDILKHEFSGTALSIGALYHISGRTRMGLSYKPGFEMTDKTKLTEHTLTTVTKTGTKYKFKYPESLSLGLSFRFPGPSEPTLFLDVVHTNWSEAKAKTGSGKWINCGYVDTMEWHIGAEHTAKSKKFRYGLAFLPDYSRKGSQKAVVSCGLGFKIWVIDFDVSGQYFMRRNTLEDRLFHVPEDDPDFERINFEITDEYTKRFLFTGKIKL